MSKLKTYEIELRRTSYITLTIEAENKERAEELAWLQVETETNPKHAQWDIESIDDITDEE